ncbi:MAG: ATP-binding protein, partial [Armatimonadota bacterium]
YGQGGIFPADEPTEPRSISVVGRLFPEYVEIDVISDGDDFRPSPGDYTMPEAESMAESGRGLALIELMMDSVEYLSQDGKHIVRMRKMR